MKYVFVYGTLRQGNGNHRLLTNATFVGSGSVNNAVIYNTGGFPALRPAEADSVVRGEVYADFNLGSLDGLEGYREGNPDRSMYLREVTSVTLDDGREVEAWFYVWNLGGEDDMPLIESGDWNEYRQTG